MQIHKILKTYEECDDQQHGFGQNHRETFIGFPISRADVAAFHVIARNNVSAQRKHSENQFHSTGLRWMLGRNGGDSFIKRMFEAGFLTGCLAAYTEGTAQRFQIDWDRVQSATTHEVLELVDDMHRRYWEGVRSTDKFREKLAEQAALKAPARAFMQAALPDIVFRDVQGSFSSRFYHGELDDKRAGELYWRNSKVVREQIAATQTGLAVHSVDIQRSHLAALFILLGDDTSCEWAATLTKCGKHVANMTLNGAGLERCLAERGDMTVREVKDVRRRISSARNSLLRKVYGNAFETLTYNDKIDALQFMLTEVELMRVKDIIASQPPQLKVFGYVFDELVFVGNGTPNPTAASLSNAAELARQVSARSKLIVKTANNTPMFYPIVGRFLSKIDDAFEALVGLTRRVSSCFTNDLPPGYDELRA